MTFARADETSPAESLPLRDEEAENRRPPAENNRAVLRLQVQADRRAQFHTTAGRHRRNVVEAQEQPREVFRAVAEQDVDAFGQEAFGVRVQAERIKEYIARQLVLRGLRGSQSDVPGCASLCRLSQQELAQHPKRVRP